MDGGFAIRPTTDTSNEAESTSDYRHSRFAHGFAQDVLNQRLDAPAPSFATYPELACVLDAWPTLPPAIRRAILALIDSSK